MFIGHIPAGYLATTSMLRAGSGVDRRRLLGLGLAASVLPDLDLLYFYLVDHQRHVHHTYLPHLPLAWVAALAVAALVMWVARARRVAWMALGVLAMNVFIHLALDTVAGGVLWGWPFSRAEVVLATVRPRYHPWFLNFILHWSFALEAALVAGALWRWRSRA